MTLWVLVTNVYEAHNVLSQSLFSSASEYSFTVIQKCQPREIKYKGSLVSQEQLYIYIHTHIYMHIYCTDT